MSKGEKMQVNNVHSLMGDDHPISGNLKSKYSQEGYFVSKEALNDQLYHRKLCENDFNSQGKDWLGRIEYPSKEIYHIDQSSPRERSVHKTPERVPKIVMSPGKSNKNEIVRSKSKPIEKNKDKDRENVIKALREENENLKNKCIKQSEITDKFSAFFKEIYNSLALINDPTKKNTEKVDFIQHENKVKLLISTIEGKYKDLIKISSKLAQEKNKLESLKEEIPSPKGKCGKPNSLNPQKKSQKNDRSNKPKADAMIIESNEKKVGNDKSIEKFINHMKEEYENKIKKFKMDLEGKREKIEHLEKIITDLRQKCVNLETDLESFKKRFEECRKESEKFKKEYEGLEYLNENLKKKINELTIIKDKKDNSKVEELEKNLKNLENKFEKKAHENNTLNNNFEKIKEEFNKLKEKNEGEVKQNKKLGLELSKKTEEINENKKNILQYMEKIASKNSEIDKIKQELKKLKKNDKTENLNLELKLKDQEILKKQNLIKKIEKEKEDLIKLKKQEEFNLKNEIIGLKATLKSENSAYTDQLKKLNNEISTLQNEKSKLSNKIIDFEKYQTISEGAATKIKILESTLTENLKKFKGLEDDKKNLNDELEKLYEENELLITSLDVLKNENEGQKENIKNLEKDNKSLKEICENIEKKKSGDLDIIKKSFEDKVRDLELENKSFKKTLENQQTINEENYELKKNISRLENSFNEDIRKMNEEKKDLEIRVDALLKEKDKFIELNGKQTHEITMKNKEIQDLVGINSQLNFENSENSNKINQVEEELRLITEKCNQLQAIPNTSPNEKILIDKYNEIKNSLSEAQSELAKKNARILIVEKNNEILNKEKQELEDQFKILRDEDYGLRHQLEKSEKALKRLEKNSFKNYFIKDAENAPDIIIEDKKKSMEYEESFRKIKEEYKKFEEDLKQEKKKDQDLIVNLLDQIKILNESVERLKNFENLYNENIHKLADKDEILIKLEKENQKFDKQVRDLNNLLNKLKEDQAINKEQLIILEKDLLNQNIKNEELQKKNESSNKFENLYNDVNAKLLEKIVNLGLLEEQMKKLKDEVKDGEEKNEYLNKVNDEINSKLSKKDHLLEELNEKYNREFETNDKKFKELEKFYEKLTKNFKDLEKEKQDLLEENKNQLNKLAQKDNEIVSLGNTIQTYEDKIKKLKEQMKKLEDEVTKNYKDRDNENQNLLMKLAQKDIEIVNLKNTIQTYEDEIKKLKDKIKKLKDKNKKLKDKIFKLSNMNLDLKLDHDQLVNKIKDLKNEEEKITKNKNDEINQLKSEINQLNSEINSLRKEVSKQKSSKDQSDRIASLKNENENLLKRIESFERNNSELSKTLSSKELIVIELKDSIVKQTKEHEILVFQLKKEIEELKNNSGNVSIIEEIRKFSKQAEENLVNNENLSQLTKENEELNKKREEECNLEGFKVKLAEENKRLRHIITTSLIFK